MPRFHSPNKLKHATLRIAPAISRRLLSSGIKLRDVQRRVSGGGVTGVPSRASVPFPQLLQLPLGAKPALTAPVVSSGAPAGSEQARRFASRMLGERQPASAPAVKLLAFPDVRLARLTPTTSPNDELLPQRERGLQQNSGVRLQPEHLSTQSRVEALRGAKHGSNGQFLYDRNGMPAWYQDAEGNFFGPNHPKLPRAAAEILDAAQRTQPSNGFELWQMQNPKGTAEDYLGLVAAGKIKPLPEQISDAERDGDTEAANRIRRVLARVRVQAPSRLSSFGRKDGIVTLTPRGAAGSIERPFSARLAK